MRVLNDLLIRNWGLKLTAIVLALIIWLIFVPQNKVISEKTLPVPLEVTNVPADMDIVERPASSVEITVRAPKRILGEIGSSSVAARLDLQHATVSQQEFPLDKSMITLPAGAEVIEIRPGKVLVKLEKSGDEIFVVRPVVRGKVAPGYVISRIEVMPPRVMVHGPESLLSGKDAVTTSPVDVTDVSETTVFEADLILLSPRLRTASGQTKARVTVIVEEDKGNPRPGPARKK